MDRTDQRTGRAACHQWVVPLFAALVTVAALMAAAPATAQQVDKLAEGFESVAWQPSQYNKAAGEAKLVTDVPQTLAGRSHHAMYLEARFSGNGFEFFNANADPALIIPGDAKRITLYVKADSEGPGYSWALMLRDGWGREKIDNKKLEWNLSKKLTDQWQQLSFDVPDDWVRPISIAGFVTHNWSSKNQAGKAMLWVDDIRAVTDISNVDPATGELKGWKPGPANDKGKVRPQPVMPLLGATVSTPDPHNVFVDTPPSIAVQARSWKPGDITGQLKWQLLDQDGKQVAADSQTVRVTDLTTMKIDLPVKHYGLYTADATLTWSDGSTIHQRMPMAMIPKPAELTEQQKIDSPYGLNVHGGRSRMIQTFRDAGIVWFRDYAFNYDWMVRAKGDGKYGGWPWYPQMVKEYNDAGAMLLACHASAIRKPGPEAATDESQRRPDMNWTRELVQMVLAFPSIRYHELDNEYDLPSHGASKAEQKIGWANYGNYHKVFGQTLHMLGAGQLVTVENGRAGIWPARIEAMVRGGYFDDIDVVNSHHYTGVEPPEVNVLNANTDATAALRPRLFFDQLRDATAAGRIDGKQRQHWLTEFGWDTAAGHVVTQRQQAAYLQRAYMMLMAADVAKGFWFFDMDGAEHPTTFFGGCGLVDYRTLPKLSLVSFAAIAHLMPTPKFVGIINAGNGTWGYVIRDGDDLIASLWTIDDVQGPQVKLGGKLYDYLANPLPGDTAALNMTPVYAVGISTDSPWYRQTAYMLASAYLEAGASGDTVNVRLQVKNNRTTAIAGAVNLELPTGWSTPDKTAAFDVAPGKTRIVPLSFTIDPQEPLGEKRVVIHITENNQPVKQIPLRVRVQPAMSIVTDSMTGRPGTSQVNITLTNSSASMSIGGQLKVQLPSTWHTPARQIAVEPIAPRQSRTLTVPVTWNGTWADGESAQIEFVSDRGHDVKAPLIPSELTLHRATGLTIDGKLTDWKPQYQLPAWLLGSTSGAPAAQIYMAWTDGGLYLAADVHDSQVRVTSPTSFWNGDVMELFIDTHDKKSRRRYEPGDHQFWFVPQPNDHRVYAGQWKRGDELSATRKDIREIRSASVATDDGYAMELFIPASQIVGYDPHAGAKIGLNLNLSVIGRQLNREVFWPSAKRDGAAGDPGIWGTVLLRQ